MGAFDHLRNDLGPGRHGVDISEFPVAVKVPPQMPRLSMLGSRNQRGLAVAASAGVLSFYRLADQLRSGTHIGDDPLQSRGAVLRRPLDVQITSTSRLCSVAAAANSAWIHSRSRREATRML